ncbi:MAG: YcxB family protein, partial [Verrucomicrobiota bacterium]
MKLTFKVDESVLLTFTENYFRHSPVHQKAKRLYRLAVPVFIAAVMAVTLIQRGLTPGSAISSALLLAIATIWYLMYPKSFDNTIRKQSRSQIEEASYQTMFGDYTLALDEAGLHSESPIGHGSYTWNAVHRVELTHEYLMIFLSGLQGFPISIAEVGSQAAEEAYAFALR